MQSPELKITLRKNTGGRLLASPGFGGVNFILIKTLHVSFKVQATWMLFFLLPCDYLFTNRLLRQYALDYESASLTLCAHA